MPADPCCFTVNHHDLSVIPEIDLEAVANTFTRVKCRDFTAGLAELPLISRGQFIGSDFIIEKKHLNAGFGPLNQRIFQPTPELIIVNNKELEQDIIFRLLNACMYTVECVVSIDQQLDKFRAEQGREPDDAEYQTIKASTLKAVRGTVQADILKEDQGQNTCIFSTEFSLKVMGDIQEFFVHNQVRNFYSVSISGYHIAEAGANPITQLALTLANGFTYVEAYLARGMKVDDFAPNLSFFFSNGMDAEYTVLGRVARRIWSTVMRERYGASPRSQKL